MKKFLSYLWPFTRKISSDINGILEITFLNGKKVLDSANANYSYGSLQKVLEFGLKQISLASVDNLLVLGMGGGCIIQSLRDCFYFMGNIVAVELDPAVIQIAKEEFDIIESDKLKILQEDAFYYVKNSREKFQLVVIDLFIDTRVPSIFYEKEFCSLISKLLSPGGSFIFNLGVNLEDENQLAQKVISNFKSQFDFQIYNNVNKTNCLLIGKNKKC